MNAIIVLKKCLFREKLSQINASMNVSPINLYLSKMFALIVIQDANHVNSLVMINHVQDVVLLITWIFILAIIDNVLVNAHQTDMLIVLIENVNHVMKFVEHVVDLQKNIVLDALNLNIIIKDNVFITVQEDFITIKKIWNVKHAIPIVQLVVDNQIKNVCHVQPLKDS